MKTHLLNHRHKGGEKMRYVVDSKHVVVGGEERKMWVYGKAGHGQRMRTWTKIGALLISCSLVSCGCSQPVLSLCISLTTIRSLHVHPVAPS